MPDEITYPAFNDATVTPSNDDDLADGCRALWIGTGGNVAIALRGNVDGSPTSKVYKNVPSGFLLPVQARRVFLTGTTATDIIALF